MTHESSLRARAWRVAALALFLPSTACGAAADFNMSGKSADAPREESAGEMLDRATSAPAFAPSPMGYPQQMTAGIAMAPPPPPPPPGMPQPEPMPSPDGPAARAGAGAERADAIVIYTADLTVAVFEVQKSIEQVAAVAKTQGGFMARRDDRSITIRVPARHFDATVKQLEDIGDVLHRNVMAEDVSEEFHDLQIQLRNLHALRERLVVLLGKASKVEEAIAVEKELSRVSGEIDRIQGRLKFLADRAQLSTITVTLEPRQPKAMEKGPFQVPLPWLPDLGIDRIINL